MRTALGALPHAHVHRRPLSLRVRLAARQRSLGLEQCAPSRPSDAAKLACECASRRILKAQYWKFEPDYWHQFFLSKMMRRLLLGGPKGVNRPHGGSSIIPPDQSVLCQERRRWQRRPPLPASIARWLRSPPPRAAARNLKSQAEAQVQGRPSIEATSVGSSVHTSTGRHLQAASICVSGAMAGASAVALPSGAECQRACRIRAQVEFVRNNRHE
jgi:hypothetical protein